ncbi:MULTISPECIES: TonB-dependent receptor domain-containing protein [unclassified Sphingobium]|uniref:TonB-dependent receptor domain-containing protein n=1 Tax=unclassified Sphingobium TaxID=2611147 RepID=UPI00214C8F0D|nr:MULTISPECIES: TonB-dependent receptor [unclassified Sphingobium]
MRLSTISRFALTVGLSAWGIQAQAADSDPAPSGEESGKPKTQQEIVVTANSREELRDILSPGVVSVVYPDDTRGEHKALPDLLDQIPGVYVRRVGGTGGYTTTSIRGSAPSQVNIYIDGVPFNLSSETAADISTIPISNVERVEVYRGVTPARFSGAPLGGAINIVTKMPTDLSGTVSAGARSYGGRQFSGNLSFPLLGGGLLLGLDMERSKGEFKYPLIAARILDGIEYGDGEWSGDGLSNTPCSISSEYQPVRAINPVCQFPTTRQRQNNSFQRDNVMVKWRNDNITAKYSFTHMDRYMPEIVPTQYGGLQGYSLIDLPEYTFPQVNLTAGSLASLGVPFNKRRQQKQYQHDGALNWHDRFGDLELALNLNFMDQRKRFNNYDMAAPFGVGSRTALYHTTRYGLTADASYTLGAEWDVTQLLELHVQHNWETMRYDADNLINSVTGLRRGDYYQHYKRQLTNIQVQDTLTFHTLGDLQVAPIFRIEKLTGPVLGSQDNPFGPSSGNYGWKPTWSVSAKKKVGSDWLLFASYGTYNRYPNFYEIYGDGVYIQAGADSVGNTMPLLREHGSNWDAGLGWNGTIAGDLAGSFRATYFQRRTKDEITLFLTPVGGKYVNSGTTITRGGEFEASLKWGDRADLQLAATVQEGHYVKGTYFVYPAIPVAERVLGNLRTLQNPRFTANARLNLHFLGGALTTFGEVRHSGRRYISQSRSPGSDENSYTYEAPLTTFDAGAHLRLPHGLTISGGVSDIFNAGPKQKMHMVGSNDGLHPYNYWKCSALEADETGDYSCFDDEANLVRQNYPLAFNPYYPRQGRTFYVTIAKSFGAKDWRSVASPALHGNGGTNWTGFYAGGHVGRGWGRRNADEILIFDKRQNGVFGGQIEGVARFDGDGNFIDRNAFAPGFTGAGAALGNTPDDGVRSDKRKGTDYGFRVGYDHQVGSWLFGLVGEWADFDLVDSVSGYALLTNISTREALPPTSYSFTRRLKSGVSLRARTGYSWRNTLGYVTAGVIRANIDHSFATTNTVNAFEESNAGKHRWGHQYGGGIEQRIAGPLTIGLEYLRTNIKDGDYTVAAGASGTPPIYTGFQIGPIGQGANSPTDIRRSESRYRIDSLRLTLGYRF